MGNEEILNNAEERGFTRVENKPLEQLKRSDIMQVMHSVTRGNFETKYRRVLAMKDSQSRDYALNQLNQEVKSMLSKQEKELDVYRNSISELQSDDDRKNYIMSIENPQIRLVMIREYNQLFTEQNKVDHEGLSFDEELGIYISQEEKNRALRDKIMSERDMQKRQKMIRANGHLF